MRVSQSDQFKDRSRFIHEMLCQAELEVARTDAAEALKAKSLQQNPTRMDSNEHIDVFVCGRVCLFGEHSDWAGGFRDSSPHIESGKCIVVGTQEGLYARVNRLDEPIMRVTVTNHEGGETMQHDFQLQPQILLQEAKQGGFWSYIAGTLYRILVNHRVSGLELNNFKTTLPQGKGLSSSAAICLMVARAFNLAYDLKLTTRGEMELAYLGEITTPSRCGRMDQGCAYGSIPILMTFDGNLLFIDPIHLTMDLYLVLVDLKAEKDTTTILKALQSCYPDPKDDESKALHSLLGPINHRIIDSAISSLQSGSAAALGQLMKEAQAEFDAKAAPICPSQLNAPILHKVLAWPSIQHLIHGGKGIGSQGDGTAQFLAKGEEEQSMVCQLLETELGLSCMPLVVKRN